MNKPFFPISFQQVNQQISNLAKTSLLTVVAMGLLAKGTAQAQSSAPLENSIVKIAQTATQPSPTTVSKATAKRISKLEAAAATVDDISSGYIDSKIKILGKISEALSDLGEQSKAIECLIKAAEIASQDPSPQSVEAYPSRLALVGSHYSNIGEIDRAEGILKHAFYLTVQSDSGGKSRQLAKIAEAYRQLNDSEKVIAGGVVARIGVTKGAWHGKF